MVAAPDVQGMFLGGAAGAQGPAPACESMHFVGLGSPGQHTDDEWVMWAVTKAAHGDSFFVYNHRSSDPWAVSGCFSELPLKGLYFLGIEGMMVSQVRNGSWGCDARCSRTPLFLEFLLRILWICSDFF